MQLQNPQKYQGGKSTYSALPYILFMILWSRPTRASHSPYQQSKSQYCNKNEHYLSIKRRDYSINGIWTGIRGLKLPYLQSCTNTEPKNAETIIPSTIIIAPVIIIALLLCRKLRNSRAKPALTFLFIEITVWQNRPKKRILNHTDCFDFCYLVDCLFKYWNHPSCCSNSVRIGEVYLSCINIHLGCYEKLRLFYFSFANASK